MKREGGRERDEWGVKRERERRKRRRRREE